MDINIKIIEPVTLKCDNLCLSLELPFYNGPFEVKRPRKTPFKNAFPKSLAKSRIIPIRFVEGGGFSIEGFNNTSTNHPATVLCHQRSPIKTLCSPPQSLSSINPPIGDPSLRDRNLEEGEICEWLPQIEEPSMINILPSCSLTPLERESSSKPSPLRNLTIPALSKEKDNPPQDPARASWQNQPFSLVSSLKAPLGEEACPSLLRADPVRTVVSESDRVFKEVDIIASFIGEEVVNDLMDQLVDEICDDEELERQRDLLVNNLVNITIVNITRVNLETDELFIASENLENQQPNTLGILCFVKSKDSLDCARLSKRRGRRSLAKMRLKDGEARGQSRISTLFNVGEGKFLPTKP